MVYHPAFVFDFDIGILRCAAPSSNGRRGLSRWRRGGSKSAPYSEGRGLQEMQAAALLLLSLLQLTAAAAASRRRLLSCGHMLALLYWPPACNSFEHYCGINVDGQGFAC